MALKIRHIGLGKVDPRGDSSFLDVTGMYFERRSRMRS